MIRIIPKEMIEIKRRHIALFLFFTIALKAISGCAKPECKTSADCSPRTCFAAKCEDKKCDYSLKQNCCGNRINESIEDGKPGNPCNCPQDYGKCEGKGKVKIGSRLEDAAYVRYLCNADSQCVLGVDKNDVIQQNFLDTLDIGILKASSVIKYPKPFDVKKDSFEFTLSIDNAAADVILPVRLTKIRLLLSSEYTRTEQLISEQEIDSTLNEIGDQATIRVPINLNYRPQEAEEAGGVRYVMDYVYKKKVLSSRAANGTGIYTDEIVRASFTAPPKPVIFVRSG